MPGLHHLKINGDLPYEELPPAHRSFVDRFIETGDVVKSAEAAGYTDSSKSGGATLKMKGDKIRRELASVIDQQIASYARSADIAILGMGTLRELAKNAESETVRMNAAKELLSRSLEGKTERKEVTHTVKVQHLDDEALDARIAKLRKELDASVVAVQ